MGPTNHCENCILKANPRVPTLRRNRRPFLRGYEAHHCPIPDHKGPLIFCWGGWHWLGGALVDSHDTVDASENSYPNHLLNVYETLWITGETTLQEINISHLGKRKIIFKYAISGGYVNSQEGTNLNWCRISSIINRIFQGILPSRCAHPPSSASRHPRELPRTTSRRPDARRQAAGPCGGSSHDV